jgi:geranylgeranyl diphosphate synthase, type II
VSARSDSSGPNAGSPDAARPDAASLGAAFSGDQLTRAIAEFTDALLPRDHPIPEIALLYKMMRDYPNRAGKMIRSRLLVASCLAHGGRFEAALPLAAALELFQNWVLIHDDIEDDSDERRGLPALHRLHPVSLAINAGDALHVYMWKVVHGANVPGAFDEFLEMINRTAEGQHMDLGWVESKRWDVRQEDYLELVRLKTARYTVVSPFKMGALAAGCVPDLRLTEAGLDLGIAFQIRDDVLNLIGDFATYGKEIAGDLLEGKRTLMLVHLLEHADADTRARVIVTLEKLRSEKTAGEIEFILEQMRSLGSIEHAQSLADQHANRGLRTLRAALEMLPGKEAANEILQTAQSLASRLS